ncbi:MAG: hypothetical protein R8G34_08220 [Paracoccaceae bacterium]|nr:hypothetical protein [Paracoccaceae bacterium]
MSEMECLVLRLDGGGTPNFEWLFGGIVGEGPGGVRTADQFDDWLVDPISFEDIRLDRQLFVDQLEVVWRGGTLKSAAPARFPVPRESGRSLKAMALPLSLRLATHAMIADAAPKLMLGHLRDKILGFGFHNERVSAFEAPVDGAEELEIAALDLLEVGYGDQVTVVDVTAFQNSATPKRLQTVMTSAGVIDEQVQFLSRLLARNDGGLPTVDDAFAFLYNSYLRPVDHAVAQSGANFFRHRDEYFLLDPDAVSIVEAGLTSIGLSGRHKVCELDTEKAR